MWVSWLRLVAAPTALVFGTFLAVFAAATTMLAFSILALRVAVIYLEMIVAIVHAWMFSLPVWSSSKAKTNRAPLTIDTSAQRYSRTSSVGSNMSSGRPQKSDSFTRLGASFSNRDFEGVGGWRLQGDSDEEELWTGISSRLEFPARRHRFSFSLGGSQMSSAIASPDLARTPARSRTPGRGLLPGNVSPEGYFSLPLSLGYSSSLVALTSAERHPRTGVDR